MYLLHDNYNHYIRAFLPFLSIHLACSIQSINPLELIIAEHQSERKEDNYDPNKEKHNTREI